MSQQILNLHSWKIISAKWCDNRFKSVANKIFSNFEDRKRFCALTDDLSQICAYTTLRKIMSPINEKEIENVIDKLISSFCIKLIA